MWILATVSGILLLLVLLLCVPADLIFYIEKDTGFKARAKLGWLFGLIEKDISRKEKKPKKEGKRKRSIKPLFAILRTTGFLKKLLQLIKSIFKSLKIHEFKIDLRVGLDDPADTGLLFAAINPAMLYVETFSSLDIHVDPDFTQEKFQGCCKGDIRAFPIQLLGHCILFIFSPATIRAIKAAMVARRK